MSIAAEGLIIDAFANGEGPSAVGSRWRLVSDQVMGGVSEGRMTYEEIEGRRALCMRGRIRLENNGGFLQLVLDLSLNGSLDASTYEGARLIVRSNAEPYNLHLETGDTPLPWQSYRHSFENSPPSFPTLLGGVAPEGRSRPNAAFDIVRATGRCQSQSGPYENQ